VEKKKLVFESFIRLLSFVIFVGHLPEQGFMVVPVNIGTGKLQEDAFLPLNWYI
jgi:hypothetical protein